MHEKTHHCVSEVRDPEGAINRKDTTKFGRCLALAIGDTPNNHTPSFLIIRILV